jgi:hypothetical protein
MFEAIDLSGTGRKRAELAMILFNYREQTTPESAAQIGCIGLDKRIATLLLAELIQKLAKVLNLGWLYLFIWPPMIAKIQRAA